MRYCETGAKRLRGYGATLTILGVAAWPLSALAAQGVTNVRLAGYAQPRFESLGDSALFLLRRVRFGVQGDITPWARFRAQVELRDLGSSATETQVAGTDLYIALAHGHWAATIGQAKVPFSPEAIMSASTIPLPDRSVVVGDAAPNRDIGLSAEWRPVSALDVQAGVYDGEGPNQVANPDKKMAYVGRVAVSPVATLELSGAAAAFPDSTWWDAAAVAHRGPWQIRAEWLRRDLRGASGRLLGWYLLAAYMVARDRVQLVGRVEQFDPTSGPRDRQTGLTGGAQYLFKGDDFKLQASYTAFMEQSGAPAVANDRIVVQMQVRW